MKHCLQILLPTRNFKKDICSGVNLPCCIKLMSSSVSTISNISLQLHSEHSQLIFKPNKNQSQIELKKNSKNNLRSNYK